MIVKLKCRVCGTEFRSERLNQLYCSDACRKQGRKEYFKSRYENNKERLNEQSKNWRESHREYIKIKQREWNKKNPDYGTNRWRKIRGSKEYTRECPICGETFTTWYPQKQTCSDACSRIQRKIREKRYKRNYHAQWIKQRYGSEEAHQQYLAELEQKKQEQKDRIRKKREATRKERIIHGECVVCGTAFETFNPRQKTCCKECGRKLQYARNDHRIPKNQIIDKDITLEALYRRDSGVCYLCGEPCDWNDKSHNVTGMNYPSIDHIVPVSRGGFHAWNNVRLAHFGCNLRKSDTLLPDVEQIIPKNAYSEKREPVVQRKQTFQYSQDGELIAVYVSTADAERKTGIKQRGIQNCARGECETYRGYVWRYA